jgi:hypothetical protein
MRLGKDTWCCGLGFRCVAGCQSNLLAIATQGSWNFATVSTAKAAVVCNVYLWSERSGDLPEF